MGDNTLQICAFVVTVSVEVDSSQCTLVPFLYVGESMRKISEHEDNFVHIEKIFLILRVFFSICHTV